MKKILFSFGLITLITTSGFAYVYDNKTADIDDLRIQGYSEATLQAVDLSRYKARESNGKYVRFYKEKQATNTLRLGRAYQRLKEYWDPIQDDGRFGEHHIQFSNSWIRNEPSYASDMIPNKPVENL